MKRVLYIEDDLVLAALIVQALEKAGLAVTHASSGSDALQIFSKDISAFSLVITDLDVPGIRGEYLIFYLRAAQKELPVVVFAATGQHALKELFALGAVKVVFKPCPLPEFIEIVEEALSHSIL